MLLPVPICFYPRIRCYLFLTAVNGCLLVCLPVCLPAAAAYCCCMLLLVHTAAAGCCCPLLHAAAAANRCLRLISWLRPGHPKPLQNAWFYVDFCDFIWFWSESLILILFQGFGISAQHSYRFMILLRSIRFYMILKPIMVFAYFSRVSAWPPRTPPECKNLAISYDLLFATACYFQSFPAGSCCFLYFLSFPTISR